MFFVPWLKGSCHSIQKMSRNKHCGKEEETMWWRKDIKGRKSR